jgi:hypothetical protein
MRWVFALFFALVTIPVAQVAADAWNGRPGPHSIMWRHPGGGPDLAATRHHYRLYDPFGSWLPIRARTG